MLACPTPLFLTGAWCCSAHNSCTAETQRVLPADRLLFLFSKQSSLQKVLQESSSMRLPPCSFRRSYPWRCLSVSNVSSVSDLFLSSKLFIKLQNIHISINSLCLIWKRHHSTSAGKAAEMRTLLPTRNNQHVEHLSAPTKQAHLERSHDHKQPFHSLTGKGFQKPTTADSPHLHLLGLRKANESLLLPGAVH